MKNSLLLLLFVVLVAIFGCNRNAELVELKELSQKAERANTLYRTADYVTAKAALTDFVHQLERRLGQPSTLNVETIKADLMISYVRLAKLEEKNNGPDKDAFMKQAIANCQQLKIKRTCSAQDLRAQVDAADSLPLQ